LNNGKFYLETNELLFTYVSVFEEIGIQKIIKYLYEKNNNLDYLSKPSKMKKNISLLLDTTQNKNVNIKNEDKTENKIKPENPNLWLNNLSNMLNFVNYEK
jgi:FKBP-type peptidyl-prolyl cis-trans isomerase (trigger factor)